MTTQERRETMAGLIVVYLFMVTCGFSLYLLCL